MRLPETTNSRSSRKDRPSPFDQIPSGLTVHQSLYVFRKAIQASILPASLFIMAGLIVALGLKNSKLSREHAETIRSATYASSGMWIPDFIATTTEDRTVRIGGAAGKRQILVYLSPGCRFCELSMPFINEMDRFSRTYSNLEVIGLTRTDDASMDSFITKHDIRFPVAVVRDARLINLLRFGPTPTIVTVDTTGKVSYAKIGMIESSREAASIMLNAVRMEAASMAPNERTQQ